MAKKKPAPIIQMGAAEWLTTYSDLMSILFIFFVLLFSMANVDSKKFDEVSASLKNTFSVFDGGGQMGSKPGDAMISITPETSGKEGEEIPEPGTKEYEEMLAGTIEELQKELEKYKDADQKDLTEEEKIQLGLMEIKAKKLENFRKGISEEIEKLGIGGYVTLESDQEKLVLRLDSQILFDSGSASLRLDGNRVLVDLGKSFKELDHDIEVQGHTDNRPISTSQFPSNWELSTQRATNVVRILQDECGVSPLHLRSTGFGEFRPIGDNNTDEGRQKNRRIDIVITS